ncbi:FadR/GntR family transcriptional regulator [Amphibiibacter pelophylacis]|uniref:FadR/GntR family transcriptional regulator n=1 Tax=Amphibiibacter pelophylacis TaxID=1799477 RepID=A0ACC6P217_9BURK
MDIEPLRPLRRAPLLHVSVQHSLRAFIEDNQLPAGAPLPPEAELAESLGVSRNSVREAVKALESVGVLETRRGVGVFVREFSFEPLLDNLAYGIGNSMRQVSEVLEIRRTLEMGLIDTALHRFTAQDLVDLRAVTQRMHDRARQGQSFPEEDREFHRILFRSQGNEVLLRLIDVFWLAFYKASDFVNLENMDPMSTWRDHQDIVDAIASGKLSSVRERLAQHYQGVDKTLAGELAPPPTQ